MELKVKDKFNIKGRGEAYTISLKENNLSPYRKDFSKLMGTEVIINNKKYKIKGIEAFATPMDYEHDSIGLLLEEIIQVY